MSHMIRGTAGESGTGRRPLLATFVGNNRQMLQGIADNLSHHLQNPSSEDEGNGDISPGFTPLRHELSQSTPNLLDTKSQSGVSGGLTKNNMTRHHYNRQALAVIKDSLRPFQNTDASSTNTSQGSVSDDGECPQVNRHMMLQLLSAGYSEDSAHRALKATGNKSVEAALENLEKGLAHADGKNGISKPTVLSAYNTKVKRKPSFEAKYGQNSPVSDNASVRSDSPSLNSMQSRQLAYGDPPRIVTSQANILPASRHIAPSPVNGHQTPPPVPPRAPIGPPQTPPRTQTPPVSAGQNQFHDVCVLNQQQTPILQQVVPPGQVQQMIKRMSPIPRTQIVSSYHLLQQPTGQAQTPPQPGGSGPVTPQRGMSPSAIGRQPVIVKQSPNIGINQQQQYQDMSVSQSQNGNANTSVASNSGGHRVTIKYTQPPPPYTQAQSQQTRTNPTVVHINHNSHSEHSHVTSQVPDYRPYSANNPQTCEILVNPSSSGSSLVASENSVQISLPKRTTPSASSPKAMPAWGAKQPPIIMQSVKSLPVQKPILQTATAPLSPSQTSAQNFISSVQAQINTPSPQSQASTPSPSQGYRRGGNVQIQITRHAQNGGHGQFSPEQMAHMQSPSPNHAGRPTIQINIQSQGAERRNQYMQNHIQSVQIQNVGHNYDYGQHSTSDTPASTPRSDSPVSRATNQSPMSVLSTTSTPSTNSDIPDKPPPPYPGRPLTMQPIQIVQPIPQHPVSQTNLPLTDQLTQPPIPPRVPLQQGKPPHPPPPVTQNSPSQAPPLPPHKNVQQTLHQSPPPPLPPPRNPQVDQSNNSNGSLTSDLNDETDTETMSTVSDTSITQEKHRCTSPMPERKPEAKEKDRLRRETLVRNYSPQAFKFFMEQHVENLLKSHQQRIHRRLQLENEMSKVGLSDEAQHQMRRMLHQKESNYIRLKRAKMDKCMFIKIKTLGLGAFGEVSLVQKKDVHQLYAMKTLRKQDVLKRNQVAHVKAERDILAEADNEWVVKLYYSFQDRDNLYFVMDYVPGGDLMGLLIKFGIFEEPLAMFYIAELVLAIESVHKMGFIHRDIKPDNILIDKDGHIKLTDFGLCTGFRWTHNSKYYQKDGLHARQDSMDVSCAMTQQCRCSEILKPLERRRHRDQQRCLAHSLVGTPNYIAPEVLCRQGYTSCCDWWSVGVILYEMLVGSPPFYAQTPAETQYKVINWEKTLQIPNEANLNQDAMDLVLRLCCGMDERLGRHGAHEIKKHPFFSKICFEGLRRQTSLYKPQIRHAMDTSNFDPVDPDKIRDSDSEDESRRMDYPENGKHPEHAFFEFTFRRFFDDGGHPYPSVKDPESNAPVYV